MKISGEQCNAASLFWTHILLGTLNPKQLVASKQSLSPFISMIEANHRQLFLEKLATENPLWTLKFIDILDSLLKEENDSLVLCLDYRPMGILKQAANEAGIPESLFPSGKLDMAFDNEGHIIVGSEIINADDFIKSFTPKMPASFQ